MTASAPSLWRQAAEGFAEAVITRATVELYSACKRARMQSIQEMVTRKQHNWNVNMIPSLTVNNLDFPGDAHPNSNPNARLGRTLENRSKDASLDVAHDEKAEEEIECEAEMAAAVPLGKATASEVVKASEDDKKATAIHDADHQVVFELDAWIKEEAEAEERRQEVLAAHADDPVKVQRLRTLYSVDREQALSQLSDALPAAIGELFGDIPVEN